MAEEIIPQKNCTRCNSLKPVSEFYRNKRSPNGRMLYCKTCSKAKSVQWARDNIEHVRRTEAARRKASTLPNGALPELTAAEIIRFRAKISQPSNSQCWEWLAAKDIGGYGTFKVRSRMLKAHRVAYKLHNGVDPINNLVCHTCDNPPCVNPAHLFLGTNADNVADRDKKGRTAKGLTSARHTRPATTARGERVNTAVLTEVEVREILLGLKAGMRVPELSRKYGVCYEAIYAIRSGKNWKHVERP